jgi:hypothetical protein
VKIICTIFLTIMVLVLAACSNSTPQVSSEAKNPPMLAGIWADAETGFLLCSETEQLKLELDITQEEKTPKLTGFVKLIFPHATVQLPFLGQVNDAGHIIGDAASTDNRNILDIDLSLTNEKLMGSVTGKIKELVVACRLDSLNNMSIQAQFEKDEDALEPNNTVSQAATLEFDREYQLHTRLNDPDWLSFTLTETRQVFFYEKQLTVDADGIAFVLFDSNQNTLHPYASFPKNILLESGTYYIRAATGFRKADYLFKITAKQLIDSAYEPNNESERATPLTNPFEAGLVLHSGDVDLFKFTLLEEEIVEVNLSSSDVRYEIFKNPTEPEYIDIYTNAQGLKAGTYYLKISAFDLLENPYTLNFETRKIGDKLYEPNNALSTPTRISLPFSQEMYLYTRDKDWLQFTLTSDQIVIFKLDMMNGRWSDSGLFDTKGVLLLPLTLDSGQVAWKQLKAGTYNIRVMDSYSVETPIPYTISVTTEDAPDRIFEPNNVVAEATPVTLGFVGDFVVSPEDNDYFKLSLEQDTTVDIIIDERDITSVEARIIDEKGYVKLSLYKGSNKVNLSGGVHYFKIATSVNDVKHQLSFIEK